MASLSFLWLNYLLFLFLYAFLLIDNNQNNLFHGLILLLFVINNIFFIAGDAITFLIFWEAMLVPATLLLYYFSKNKSKENALEFILYNFGFSIFLILGILMQYKATQTFELDSLKKNPQSLTAILLFIGIMVKTPVFPLHGWLLNTYYNLPSTVTAIFSGILSKYALYAFYRLYDNIHMSLPLLLILTLLSAIIASLLALYQKDIKKIFTYMSMSHLNIALAGSLGMLPYTSIYILIPFSLFHGLLAFILFIFVSYLEKCTDNLNINEYGNLTAVSPIFTIFLTTFLLVLSGFPLFAYFYIELIMLSSLFKYSILFGFLLSIAISINLTYKCILFYKLVFSKKTGIASQKLADLPFNYISISLIIFLLLISLTIFFYPFMQQSLSIGGL
ncbi:MAG: proton-conducting transporter membrane subunit [Caldimicrobium sp.]